MNLWQKIGTVLLRWFVAIVLVLNVTSCGSSDKVVSQEPTANPQQKVQLSGQISEVSPPAVIQELRQTLEIYQPQVNIVAPKADEILQDNTVTARFQVKDLPIFKDSKWDLGSHLHVILDNEPYIAVYDLDKPLVLSDLSPGTHTLRVFASRPWHESFKNEGAYAQSTFHIFTKTDSNNPDPKQPLLTYSRPKGDYGAEPILLDFYLTNAPLHLVARENPNDEIADWRIRCTVNGESFVLDRWQSVYLKGFKPGKNWVELEFLDEQGNPIKNVFNSTARLITYDPKGKDTLSRIVRGELSAEQVRTIVDPNYTAKPPVVEPTPSQTPIPTVEKEPEVKPQEPKQPVTELEPTPVPTSIPGIEEKAPETQVEKLKQPISEPELQEIPQTQPEQAKPKGFFNRFKRLPETTPTPETTVAPNPPSEPPTLPEVIETPQPEAKVEPQAPKAESTTIPETLTQPEPTTKVEPTTPLETVTPQPQKKGRFTQYFNRQANKTPAPSVTVEPTSSEPPNLPEIIESPQPEIESPQPETVAPQP